MMTSRETRWDGGMKSMLFEFLLMGGFAAAAIMAGGAGAIACYRMGARSVRRPRVDADALGEALADAKHAREELAKAKAELVAAQVAEAAAREELKREKEDNSSQTVYRDAQAETREAHFDALLSNIESYDGTENGQRTVIPL